MYIATKMKNVSLTLHKFNKTKNPTHSLTVSFLIHSVTIKNFNAPLVVLGQIEK